MQGQNHAHNRSLDRGLDRDRFRDGTRNLNRRREKQPAIDNEEINVDGENPQVRGNRGHAFGSPSRRNDHRQDLQDSRTATPSTEEELLLNRLNELEKENALLRNDEDEVRDRHDERKFLHDYYARSEQGRNGRYPTGPRRKKMRSTSHIPDDRDYGQEDGSSDDDINTITEARLCEMIEKHSDELMCKMFPQSLDGGAIKWFNKLLTQSFGTYHELVGEFCSHYKYNRRERKGCHDLFILGIRKEESIIQFTRRFKQELDDVDGANDQVIIASYKQEYQHDHRGVYGSLVKRPANTLEELYDRAEEYARVEDDSKAQEMRDVNRSSNHPNNRKKDKSKNHSSGQYNDRGEVREKTTENEWKLDIRNIMI
ncbi:uncharacterized protein LOC113271996 [Papaver somniferum]|uniref:uncharacterized protein LOC113271996 n=1 Tax=Papaver somniferum TaxID=3469 RepID=UPI000E6FD574|nr:uncharacterized protein LOC113271996 [Papaver somniferum]